MEDKIYDKNIESYTRLITPVELKENLSVTQKVISTVIEARKQIAKILNKEDNRTILIIGPCSVHNVEEALTYANKVKELQEKVKDKFILIMRTYFEKPRTTTGWKGLVYDPNLDESDDIEKGLKLARKLLININEMGVPCGTEFLGMVTPQYFDDLISWAAIGARNTESQPHREMVSGLSMPVGFKNDTQGNVGIAINSMKSSLTGHSFLGVNQDGKVSVVKSKGNKYVHIILRGGNEPNYHPECIKEVEEILIKNNFTHNVIIDCSHGNSKKDFTRQPLVFNSVIDQIKNKDESIVGLMLESNLEEGNQKICDDLKPGVSITDECISWDTTEKLIMDGYNKL
ncbi:3-deoxy-7-phosphoheptulonate synthase [Candidatus Woesearchaeota archaeon]|nr:3-deoxy-7-phosphoheptulonate synthase [Candidatus Woesearchaeota archaeon]